jgi:hypothetical protein
MFSSQHAVPLLCLAQVVSSWLPTAAARVRVRVWSSGICGGQRALEVGFLRVPRFSPCQSSFHQIISSQSPGAGFRTGPFASGVSHQKSYTSFRFVNSKLQQRPAVSVTHLWFFIICLYVKRTRSGGALTWQSGAV